MNDGKNNKILYNEYLLHVDEKIRKDTKEITQKLEKNFKESENILSKFKTATEFRMPQSTLTTFCLLINKLTECMMLFSELNKIEEKNREDEL